MIEIKFRGKNIFLWFHGNLIVYPQEGQNDNDNSVGAVTHLSDRIASECVSLARDDVKEELLKYIEREIKKEVK